MIFELSIDLVLIFFPILLSFQAISEGDETNLTSEELARATILKERSLRKKEKKDKQLKWKQKKLSIKSGVAIAAIAAIKKATQK